MLFLFLTAYSQQSSDKLYEDLPDEAVQAGEPTQTGPAGASELPAEEDSSNETDKRYAVVHNLICICLLFY